MAETLKKNRKSKLVRDPQRSRKKILYTAEKLFARRGFDASVDDIADRAGLNKRMIYHYFGSKEGLWNAVLLHQYEKASLPELDLPQNIDLVDMVEILVEKYYRFLAADPKFVRLLMFENLRRGKSITAIPVAETKLPVLQSLTGALKKIETNRSRGDLLLADHLLIDCIALCFFFFSNQSTLSAALGVELSGQAQMELRIRHVKSLLRRALEENK